MTDQEKVEKLKKFVDDPDWHIVEEVFNGFIDPLRNIESIDLKEDSSVIKAEVKIRLETCNRIKSLLQNLGLLKTTNDKPQSNTFR